MTTLVAYVEASGADTPGHLVIGDEPADGPPLYVGYRFDPADLPAEYQSVERYREYLFDHAVPGHIIDEGRYVAGLFAGRRRYHVRRVVADRPLADVLPPRHRWVGFALYSFDPDAPAHPGRCYNCVTWGVETANSARPGFLEPVRQGRVKLIIQQFEPVEPPAPEGT